MAEILTELKRSNLISGSKRPPGGDYKDQSKGRNRFDRRLKSKISNSVKEFNNVNMNKLFTQDILDLNIEVIGETDKYLVKVSFSGVLKELLNEIKQKKGLNVIVIMRAITKAFNNNDVYVHCTCPDWKYRFGYWALLGDINSDVVGDGQAYSGLPGGPEPDITNPDDNKGFACKHTLLVLHRTTWINKIASVINNYINYMERHKPKEYKNIIYPAIYNSKYVEPERLEIDIPDVLPTDSDFIDTSNKWARTKSRYKNKNNKDTLSKPKAKADLDSLVSD